MSAPAYFLFLSAPRASLAVVEALRAGPEGLRLLGAGVVFDELRVGRRSPAGGGPVGRVPDGGGRPLDGVGPAPALRSGPGAAAGQVVDSRVEAAGRPAARAGGRRSIARPGVRDAAGGVRQGFSLDLLEVFFLPVFLWPGALPSAESYLGREQGSPGQERLLDPGVGLALVPVGVWVVCHDSPGKNKPVVIVKPFAASQ